MALELDRSDEMGREEGGWVEWREEGGRRVGGEREKGGRKVGGVAGWGRMGVE